MAEPHITITLGRSCQRVVKDSLEKGGPKDLRLKLTHKRNSSRMELENEERKKMKHSVKRQAYGNVLRSISSSGAGETLDVSSMRSVYASLTSDAARIIPPRKFSAGTSPPRSAIDPLDSSRPKFPTLDTSRRPLDSGNVVARLPPPTGGMFRPPCQDNQSLTVSSLLHSLGLGKYAVNFKAEEIDMIVLKQMGDDDLKELGLPMGPRKKILFALQAQAKRPVTQAHMNNVQ